MVVFPIEINGLELNSSVRRAPRNFTVLRVMSETNPASPIPVSNISVYFKTRDISPRSKPADRREAPPNDIWRNRSADLERSPMEFLRVPLSPEVPTQFK